MNGFELIPIDWNQAGWTIAVAAVTHETGVLEDPQVLRDRGPAHRQLGGELPDRPRAVREGCHDRASCGIPERGPAVVVSVSAHER